MSKERIVVIEGTMDDERELVVRERVPTDAALVQWRGTGPARGAFEDAVVEYIEPERSAA